jgi:hypothetical protein
MRDKSAEDPANGEQLATITHARLRAAQGDIRGARALLLDILHRNPAHREAKALLSEIAGRADRRRESGTEEPLAAPEAGDPRRLGAGFRRFLLHDKSSRRARIERLEELLRRITGENS